MSEDKTFQVALTISLIVHTTIFVKLPHINLFSQPRNLNHQIELTYIREKDTLPSIKLYKQTFPEKASHQASSRSVAPPPYVKNEQIFKKVKSVSIKKPELHKTEIISVKKKISLPSLSDEKANNPVYLNYYQIIREKIKRAAYGNYTRLVSGEVHLSFVVLNSGKLRDLRIDEEKSTAYNYLKDITQKSIYDAEPFPEFPPELDYPELSFNVIISFEVE
jgi:outer membrane biosynthesis protein TonB